ncbi:50S ribosomal protein L32 [Candidatus Uhrbacteria bacterium]|nr:50S ribosomal protein L32 [Candidatus Uhrbacteria bacterium]
MGLPGKRLSRSSKRRRASHFALKKQVFVKCAHCSKPILPHRVCPSCGTYKGRSVLVPKVKGLKKALASSKQKEN